MTPPVGAVVGTWQEGCFLPLLALREVPRSAQLPAQLLRNHDHTSHTSHVTRHHWDLITQRTAGGPAIPTQ